ncbi:hypothetical protein [uncultured Clostridium sp.]|uniref:hypothetical protein n=1 Tax=uncultured Clostridium sp. TaxID=59620 RepID=UPI0025F07D0A|nr:hypothetical protein [uncultured Clostridium sp.]
MKKNEVNEKQVKVSRKDRFKKKKKSKIGVSSAPIFMTDQYGLINVTDRTFQFKNGDTNRLYKVTISEDTDKRNAFNVMRLYDIPFSIFYIKNSIYLMITIHGKDLDSVEEKFQEIEKHLFLNMKKNQISIDIIPFEERMRLIHICLINGLDKENINVTNYYENISGWKSEFLFQDHDGFEEKYLTGDREETFRMLYIRQEKTGMDALVHELERIAAIDVIRFDYEPVPDQAVGEFFRNNYMGCERELKAVSRNNPEIYDIYIGNVDDEDKRQFTMVGVSFLIHTQSVEEMCNVEKEIKFIMDRYECSYEYYYGLMKETFLGFIPFLSEGTKQLRLVQHGTQDIGFLAGKGKIKTEISEENSVSSYYVSEYKEEVPHQIEESYIVEDQEDSLLVKESDCVFDYIL